MRFFLNIFRKKRIRPFCPRESLWRFCLFSCALKAIRIDLLKSVSRNSALLSNPLRCLPSIYLWTRVIIYNSAGLWIAVPLSSIFQLRCTSWRKKRHNILTHIHHFLVQKYYFLNKNFIRESKAMIKKLWFFFFSVWRDKAWKFVIFFIHTAWGQQTRCDWIISWTMNGGKYVKDDPE